MEECERKQVNRILLGIRLVLIFLALIGVICVTIVKKISFLEALPILLILLSSSIGSIVINRNK